LLKTVSKRYPKDGLNTLDYDVVFSKNSRLYTHIMLNVGDPPKDLNKVKKMKSWRKL